MPSGAPPPMQFAQLKFADQPKTNTGQQMQTLGKNLKAAGADKLFQPTPPAVVPGAAVPGAQGPTSAGGPQGPMPLVAPGTPGPSVAPPAAAVPAGPQMAPPAAPPAPTTPPIQLPQIVQAPPAVPGPSAATVAQSMAPQAQLDWLRRIAGIGPNTAPPSFPGSTALQGAGILPSSPGFGPAPGMPQPPISS
jgi:hypothetical protein